MRKCTELPVRENYDVIVVGDGVAGVAAAIAAKRKGAQPLLLEKAPFPVAIYLPLCDGKGK